VKITNYVEIELTTDCDLKCYNCDRSCGQIEDGRKFSMSQLEFFLKENKDGFFKCVALLGGEPTTHPRFFEIVDLFKEKKQRFALVTHGLGRDTELKIEYVEKKGFSVYNSEKTGKINIFNFYNLAPIDFGIEDVKPCGIPSSCGYGLTIHGYYPCGAGGAIDRIFGFNIGLESIEEITEEKTDLQLAQLCKYCGHSPSLPKDASHTFPGQLNPMSPSWKKAYASFIENPPKMKIYGDGK